MPLACEIRPARAEDSAALQRLIKAHAEFEGSRAPITGVELRDLLVAASPPATILLATARDTLLGYAALTTDYSLWRARRWVHLDCLFVHSDYRGHSVGRRLFDSSSRIAKELGADQMEWQTPAWNEPAIDFYKARGAMGAPKMRFTLAL